MRNDLLWILFIVGNALALIGYHILFKASIELFAGIVLITLGGAGAIYALVKAD